MLLGLAALVALGSVEALTGTARTDGGGDRWQYRLRLSAPEPHVRIDPDHPEWGSVLQIPSFDRIPPQPSQRGGAGRPAAEGQVPLPVKVLRVAIPDGAQVSLESIQASRRVLKGLRLGPAEVPDAGASADAGASDAGAGPIAEPAAGETDSTGGPETDSGSRQTRPAPVLRLGQVGWFRSQKFVEILYTPALPGPSDEAGLRDVEFFATVDASLVVTGVDWEAVAGNAAVAARDPHFEESYEKAFVNYEEGKAFRSRAPDRRRGDETGTQAAAALNVDEPLSPSFEEGSSAVEPPAPVESLFWGRQLRYSASCSTRRESTA